MIPVRLIFYSLYVVLGVVIVVRMLATGWHWEALTGIIFGSLLIALGAYRLLQFSRRRADMQ